MRCMVVLAMLGLAWSVVAVEPARNATSVSRRIAGGPAKPAKAAEDTNSTVITSTQLSFDQQKRKAVFEENVVVTDREIKILSDRLEVFFTEDNKVDRIEAEGHVTIIRNDLRATGDKASYDMKEGKMQLTGNPRIQRDQDTLTGETVTLWRNSRRILCEPNARLVIASEQEINRSFK
ncbi:MAG: LPS export ABC transporter periplasmic protein LptC [Verrucomicrobia bacterium]|nr:LPS export ABC transporter periplasmic protein LptC [Verrucomicrobiota bacterium]MBU4367215.1 LPS export ABC transporter periplasmic protein LptC [Verrucomicrobiota bacterium]